MRIFWPYEVSDCAERALLKAVSLDALFKAMAGAHSKIMYWLEQAEAELRQLG